jgi:site-specific recombinase XerD
VNIKWTDIDLGNMTVRISQSDDFQTKSKKERTISLNEDVYDVLAVMERKGEYVFCRQDGKKRDKHFIARRFKACLKSVALGDGYSFHSLRHTFASHLVQKGVSLYIVSKLLGHADVKTTEIYAHLAPETFHDVVGLLGFGNERKKKLKVGELSTT